MQHGENLTLHRRERLGGFHLDQILIEGGHDPRKRQHEIRERRGHMSDKAGGGGMHRLSDQLLFDKLGVFRDVSRLFGDRGRGEISLDLFNIPL